jgi:Sulfotransferase family
VAVFASIAGQHAARGSDRPIFVSGCPRSGTTLLQVMLHAHQRIAIPPEDRELLEVYHARHRFGDLRKPSNHRRLAQHLGQGRRFKLGADAIRDAVLDAPATLGSALGAVRQAYAGKFDKPRWGDKRPAFLLHYDVILRLFPDAQLIHIVRDGRACVASLKRMPWWTTGATGAMARWVESMKAGERLRRRLRWDQYCEIRYEDLVAHPRAVAEQLCTFLGEEFDEAMLAPEAVAAVAVPRRKRNQRQTRKPINTRAVESWREELTPQEVALFERVAGRHLTAQGYSLSNQTAAAPATAQLGYLGHLYGRAARRLAKRARDLALRVTDRQPIAAQLTTGQRRPGHLPG